MGLLEGKVGLVTGAASGIGRATAELAAREGSCVVVADINDPGGEETVRAIEKDGGQARFVHTDVSDEAQVASMVQATLERFGALHWASNNAKGGGGYGYLAEISRKNWNRTLEVTLTGVWLCMKAEIPAMLAGGGGSIVNISSLAGLKGETFLGAYAAAKGGVLALTKTAAAEYATRGLRVNNVCPGGVGTPAIEHYFEKVPAIRQRTIDTHAMRRLGEPEELAEAVVWLASDRSSFITGHSLCVDGGNLVNSHIL